MDVSPPPVDEHTSIVRLHGEACFYCGAVHTKLYPADTVQTPVKGGVRVWQIVACAEHRERGEQ
jgi:hypothetical protein